MVGRHFFGPDWQAGDERSLGGSQGDRRLREWRKLGYVLEARPPVTGSGPWDYRLGCHPSGGQLAEIRQHLTRLTGHPEAEAVRERLNKAHRRNGLSEWIADEALEDLRRI